MVEGVQVAPVQRVNNNRNMYIGIFICVIASVMIGLSINFISSTDPSSIRLYGGYNYPISHICRNDSCIIDRNNKCEKNLSYCSKINPPSCSRQPYIVYTIIIAMITMFNILLNLAAGFSTFEGGNTHKILIASFIINCIYFGIISILYLDPFNGNNTINPISYQGAEYMNCYDLYYSNNLVKKFYEPVWTILSYGVYIVGSQGLLIIIETK
jgi:hypothetical protein